MGPRPQHHVPTLERGGDPQPAQPRDRSAARPRFPARRLELLVRVSVAATGAATVVAEEQSNQPCALWLWPCQPWEVPVWRPHTEHGRSSQGTCSGCHHHPHAVRHGAATAQGVWKGDPPRSPGHGSTRRLRDQPQLHQPAGHLDRGTATAPRSCRWPGCPARPIVRSRGKRCLAEAPGFMAWQSCRSSHLQPHKEKETSVCQSKAGDSLASLAFSHLPPGTLHIWP